MPRTITTFDASYRRDRARATKQREQKQTERAAERARMLLLTIIAELGPRAAVVVLNDALRLALDAIRSA